MNYNEINKLLSRIIDSTFIPFLNDKDYSLDIVIKKDFITTKFGTLPILITYYN